MRDWMDFITVTNIRTGHAFTTKSLGVAADRLVPGTTYATGWTKENAERKAEERRQKHLAQGY